MRRTTSSQPAAWLPNIQALRAFAASNVVLYHVLGTAGTYALEPDRLRIFGTWGQCGVDIFFVISGFVITLGHLRRGLRFSAARFLLDRAVRIIPIYWILTVAILFLQALHPVLFRQGIANVVEAMASLLLMSQFTLGVPPVIYVGWTLEYELIFYAIFAVAVVAFRGWAAALFMALLIWILIETTFLKHLALEFVFGVCCAYIFTSLRLHRGISTALLCLGVVLLLVSAFVDVGVDRVLLYGVPSAFLVLGAAGVRQINSPLLIHLGAASYSTYLIQVFVISAFYKFASWRLVSCSPDLLAMGALIITCCAGSFLYLLVERPATDYIRRLVIGPGQN